MKIFRSYLLCLLALGGLSPIAIPVMAMHESTVNIEQPCYRCNNLPGSKDFNILYRCKTPHPEKLCRNCYNSLITSSKKGKNPAKCPICGMNSWTLSDNTPASPLQLTPEEYAFINGTSDAGGPSRTLARAWSLRQEASHSITLMYLCIAAISAGTLKYIWHKLKKDRKNLPTEQAPITPDATKNE